MQKKNHNMIKTKSYYFSLYKNCNHYQKILMHGTELLVTDFFFIADGERNDIQRYSSNWERSRIEDF